MEILSVNADQKLINIASSIGRNPQSWDGWYCLYLNLEDIDDDTYQECFLWMKSIVDSYLKDIEGRVYFCGNKSIHMFCKMGFPKILKQAGFQICDLIYDEVSIGVEYDLFDLSEKGFSYAQIVLEETSNILSLPVSIHAGSHGVSLFEKEAIGDSKQGAVKVLLVEDDPVTRWMVRNALKRDCEFMTTASVNKAFSLYSSYQPDIVFLDINLPDGDGYTVLEWIIRNDPGACVVMFSSNDNLDNISNALEYGASGFIAKPFLKENLLHYIQNYA